MVHAAQGTPEHVARFGARHGLQNAFANQLKQALESPTRFQVGQNIAMDQDFPGTMIEVNGQNTDHRDERKFGRVQVDQVEHVGNGIRVGIFKVKSTPQ